MNISLRSPISKVALAVTLAFLIMPFHIRAAKSKGSIVFAYQWFIGEIGAGHNEDVKACVKEHFVQGGVAEHKAEGGNAGGDRRSDFSIVFFI